MTFSDWLETQKIAAHQGAPASAAAADAAVGWRPTTGQRRSLPNAPLVDWPVLQSSCQLLPTARRLVSAAEEDALIRTALVQSGAASAAGTEAKAAAWRGWLRADREAVEERDRAKARRAGSAVERLLASPHWAALSSGAAPGSGTAGLFEGDQGLQGQGGGEGLVVGESPDGAKGSPKRLALRMRAPEQEPPLATEASSREQKGAAERWDKTHVHNRARATRLCELSGKPVQHPSAPRIEPMGKARAIERKTAAG